MDHSVYRRFHRAFFEYSFPRPSRPRGGKPSPTMRRAGLMKAFVPDAAREVLALNPGFPRWLLPIADNHSTMGVRGEFVLTRRPGVRKGHRNAFPGIVTLTGGSQSLASSDSSSGRYARALPSVERYGSKFFVHRAFEEMTLVIESVVGRRMDVKEALRRAG